MVRRSTARPDGIDGHAPPLPRTHSSTLIDNQGVNPIEGTFLGLPEGGSLDLGSQRVADITYLGGDGNDVTLTLQYRGSVITVR